MEKRISFFEYQNAVSVTKLIDPFVEKLKKAEAEEKKLRAAYQELGEKISKVTMKEVELQKKIDSYESGIVKIIGFHANDLVKKVTVPTGKTTPGGKPAMTTDFVPSDIVTFDETTKEYIITTPDPENPEGGVEGVGDAMSPLNN